MRGVPDARLPAGFEKKLEYIRLRQIGGAEFVLGSIELEAVTCRDYSDGVLRGMDEGAVDLLTGRSGLGTAMVHVGLLEPTDKGLRWLNWKERQPYAFGARQRSLDNSKAGKRSAAVRKERNAALNASSTDRSTDVQRSGNPRPVLTRPVPTQPDPPRPGLRSGSARPSTNFAGEDA